MMMMMMMMMMILYCYITAYNSAQVSSAEAFYLFLAMC